MRGESDQPAKNGGWFHRLRDDDDWRRPIRRRAIRMMTDPKPAGIDFDRLAAECQAVTSPEALGRLAADLGLSVESLRRLGVGWSVRHRAWTFPMSDAAGRIVGIRLRLPSGRKLSIKGGKEGLFIPSGLEPGGMLLVCEGPTDASACLGWGIQAVGRPSCCGGVKHLCELVRRLRPEQAVVVADGDGPGRRGAERLAATLAAYASAVRVITPPVPHKDARAWRQSGGTAADVQTAIDAAPVRRLTISTRKKGRRHDARTKQARGADS